MKNVKIVNMELAQDMLEECRIADKRRKRYKNSGLTIKAVGDTQDDCRLPWKRGSQAVDLLPTTWSLVLAAKKCFTF